MKRMMKLVRCDGCGAIKYGSTKNIKCWSKFKLCRECAIVKHPEEYTDSYIKMVASKQSGNGRKHYHKVKM